jgi:ABC-type branched-subunit amino acid transport system ATPase component
VAAEIEATLIVGRQSSTQPPVGSSPVGAILEVQKVTRRFGGVVAVNDVSFGITPGTVTGLIGPNGSGKSTLFRLISAEMPANSGDVRLRGHSITGKSLSEVNRLGLGRTFQLSRLYPAMTATENLVAVTRATPKDALDRALASLDFVGLTQVADEFAANLSYGQQKLLEFARVLVNDPEVILLDEPFAGVNPVMEERMVAHIHELRDRGKTFLITDHEIRLIMALCSRLIVLDHGELLADGDPATVRADARVIDAYFGT